jgi:serine/threonine protein kinase
MNQINETWDIHVKKKYNVEKELGKGGEGVVYLLKLLNNGRKDISYIALKVVEKMTITQKRLETRINNLFEKKENIKSKDEIRTHLLGVIERKNNKTRANLELEFKLMSSIKLNSPSCSKLFVNYLHIEECTDAFLLYMEYITGYTLRDLEYKTMEGQRENVSQCIYSEDMYKTIMKYILQGLSCLHENGIVHADIKEENIMFNRNGLKLIDYGFSCRYLINSTADKTELCNPLSIAGTDTYIAPEIIFKFTESGSSAWEKIDLWSLGMTMLTLINLDSPRGVKSLLFKYPKYQDLKINEKIKLLSDLMKPNIATLNKLKDTKLREAITQCLVVDYRIRLTPNEILTKYF